MKVDRDHDRRGAIQSARLMAGLATIALVAALLVARVPSSSPIPIGAASDAQSNAEDSPLACVTRMIAAAQAGNVATYRACFTGQPLKELSSAEGADNGATLRQSVADLLGYATHDLEMASDGRARLVLERIHAGYNDVQRVDLYLENGRWKIDRIERLDRPTPEIPYGTPIYAAPPPSRLLEETSEP